MKVLLFGGSGMVGQGVLRECLADPAVMEVVSVGRTSLAQTHPKLRQILHLDLFDLSSKDNIRDFDACFFCLGVSSFRMKEEAYRHVTQALTLSIAKKLLTVNAAMVFLYVSGQGTRTGSKVMWSRVKGETEDALLAMPFRAAYMFRPGIIVPMHGIVTKTAVYRLLYTAMRPLFWLLRRSPRLATTTEAVGRAMLRVSRTTPVEHVLGNVEINRLGK